jgi:hypothetical protein
LVSKSMTPIVGEKRQRLNFYECFFGHGDCR